MLDTYLRKHELVFCWITILICYVSAKLSISKYKKIENKSVSDGYHTEYFIKKAISKGYPDCLLGCEQIDTCSFVTFQKGRTQTNECSHYINFPSENKLVDSNDSTIFLKKSNTFLIIVDLEL